MLADLLWRGLVDLSSAPLYARLYNSWSPAVDNVFAPDLQGAVPLSDPAYLGALAWYFDDPGGDGYGPGWVLEPGSKTTSLFGFIPANRNLVNGGGWVTAIVYDASTGYVVSRDGLLGPGMRGEPRPSPLHDVARVYRMGQQDPRSRSWFFEKTEIGGLASMTYWALRLYFSGHLNWLTMPMRVLLLNDSWKPTRREVKYAVTVADIPPGAIMGTSPQVPYEHRAILNGVVFYGTPSPPDSMAMPVHDVAPGQNVYGAAFYRDIPPYEVLRIATGFSLYGGGATSGDEPVWVSPISMNF